MASGTKPAEHALEVVALARDGRFAEIGNRFAPPLRAVVSTETLCAAWGAEIGRAGAVRVVGAPLRACLRGT